MTQINLSDVDASVGLSDSQVHQQVNTGNKNTAEKSLTRSTKEILSDNIFTLFNLVNIVLGVLIFYTGSYKNLLFLGIAFFNTIIGIIQEIRSKRQIDKMVLLAESKTKVIRNGNLKRISQDEIVLGDVIQLSRGDQIPVDGIVLTSKEMQVDESQITGEAAIITKRKAENLTSGSFLVSGSGRMLVTKVGKNTFVNHISNEAKKGTDDSSVLLNTINKIIKVLTFVIIPLGLILFFSKLFGGGGINRAILGTSAAVIGMIPEGLVLLTSVTLAISAMNLARRRTLVRDLPAIETLARVDVICLDKTGTITSGKLKFEKAIPFLSGVSVAQLQKVVAAVTYSTEDDNETANAITNHIKNPKWNADSVIPFSSERKWSGASFTKIGKFVVGAPQFIFANLPDDQRKVIHDYAKSGFRVLSVAKVNALNSQGKLENPQMLGLILISDVIRPNASTTFSYFATQGVDIKVISGDDPVTVSTIAAKAGITHAQDYIDMSTVSDADDFKKIVAGHTVFGRVTPDQKQKLIAALQAQNHTVAMTGDGVNDLLAIRQANCGIAMASGSESTKSIADFVLIDSNFDAMIGVLNEGRRVINNIQRVASLYLIKTMYSVALSLIFIFMTYDYPFQPIQLTPITSLFVGLPSFFLALQPNFRKISNQFMKHVLAVSLPAAICVVSYVMIIQFLGFIFGLKYQFTSTLCVLLTGAICWLALVVVSIPWNRMKITLNIAVLTAFLLIIIFFNNIFSLVTFFNKEIWLFAIPLIVTSYPLFIFMRRSISKYLNKRERKNGLKDE